MTEPGRSGLGGGGRRGAGGQRRVLRPGVQPGQGSTTPEWREGVYTDRGKWMDGWESRRRRSPGHDWCIVRLGIAGEVKRVLVDTTHFRGNYPEACSLEACGVGLDDALPGATWEELLPRSELKGDAVNDFDVEGGRRVTHLRLNIFPDGGVARLRVLGVPLPALQEVAPEGALPDLAGAVVGGSVVEASDDFFGSAGALLRPGPSTGMFDGWETRRRRGEGNDWVKVRLGLPGTPRQVLVDTSHFKGNAPGWVAVEASADGERWVTDRGEAMGRCQPAASLRGRGRCRGCAGPPRHLPRRRCRPAPGLR